MVVQAGTKRAHWMLFAFFALAPTAVLAQQDDASPDQSPQGQDQIEAAQGRAEEAQVSSGEAEEKTEDGAKAISGMSILGNQEAPTSLVIVPWKSSEIGDSIDISTMLDDSRQPVDKEVFIRALLYYQIRSETKP